jgi:Tfp pilus assembly protein PilZ
MSVQRHQRLSKRMPCAVKVGEHHYAGFVLNLSRGGVFVQTGADAGRGSVVGLELNAPDEGDGIPLEGTVAWRKVVPGQLRQVTGGGFGLQIERADERYYQALARWMCVEIAEPGTPQPEASAWRVRIRAGTGPRSRSLTVEAPNAEDAGSIALEHAGEGWRVIEVAEL